jgi:hypothetical protein
MLTTSQIIAITGIATLVATAVVIYVTLKGVRDELWLQTFAEYTGRYRDYAREIPPFARDPHSTFTLADLAEGERARILNAARMYVNLCSEEHYLHSRQKIDEETWAIWTQGMRDTFEAAWFREAWASIQHEYRLYPAFCEFFEDCLGDRSRAQATSKGEAQPVPDGVAQGNTNSATGLTPSSG